MALERVADGRGASPVHSKRPISSLSEIQLAQAGLAVRFLRSLACSPPRPACGWWSCVSAV